MLVFPPFNQQIIAGTVISYAQVRLGLIHKVIHMKKLFTKLAIVIATVSFLGACSTIDERLAIVEMQKEIIVAEAARDKARFEAESNRYRAMATVARDGDSAVKTAASIMLGKENSSASAFQPKESTTGLRLPPSTEDKVFKWASLFVNPVTSIIMNKQNNDTEIVRSNNMVRNNENMFSSFTSMGLRDTATYNNSFNSSAEGAVTGVND